MIDAHWFIRCRFACYPEYTVLYALPSLNVFVLSGQLMNVENTLFDLRKPQFLASERLSNVPGVGPRGYDHCFCLSQNSERKFASKLLLINFQNIIIAVCFLSFTVLTVW